MHLCTCRTCVCPDMPEHIREYLDAEEDRFNKRFNRTIKLLILLFVPVLFTLIPFLVGMPNYIDLWKMYFLHMYAFFFLLLLLCLSMAGAGGEGGSSADLATVSATFM